MAPTTEQHGLRGTNLTRSVYHKLARNLFRGPALRANTLGDPDAAFEVKMDYDAYDYNTLGSVDAGFLYYNMKGQLHVLAENIPYLTPDQDEKIQGCLAETLSRMVYGSNAIDGVGGNRDVTLTLCRAIFTGDTARGSIENKRKYEAVKADLKRRCMPRDRWSVLRCYRQIVQHAEAARYLIHELLLRGNDLTEDIILETHRILTDKINGKTLSWEQYSGKYRQRPACTDLRHYTPPTQVPGAMASLISSLTADLAAAVAAQRIDPVALAAKYCHMFVNIHPFAEGNGRVGRLLLNALLLKYGGMLVAIGDDEDNRDEYMTIAAAASHLEDLKQDDLDGLEERLRPRFWDQLAAMTLGHARDSVDEIVYVLEERRRADVIMEEDEENCD